MTSQAVPCERRRTESCNRTVAGEVVRVDSTGIAAVELGRYGTVREVIFCCGRSLVECEAARRQPCEKTFTCQFDGDKQ